MKKYLVYMRAFAQIEVNAENEEEAEKIALSAPCEKWEINGLSHEYAPVVDEIE